MSELFTPLTVPFLLAMFLAINMGGSGTSPAFAAAYGANVIQRTLIPGLFGIMVLCGALIAGKEVSLTLGKGLLEQSFFTPLNTSVILLSISLSLLLANVIGVPQSTSQATVLAISGAATALSGLNTQKLFYEIIPTWIILPIVSFAIMYILSKWIFPLLKAKIFTENYSHLREHKILKILLLLASMYVAFSIGANNVANAAAPIASLAVNEMAKEAQTFLPITILSVLVVAPCFAIGSSLLGHRVTQKTGKEIVKVSPFQAMVLSLIVASLLLLASVTSGIPTSLVQLNGAAFIALSVNTNGIKNTLKNKTVKQFFFIWIIAPFFAYLLSYSLILLLK
ncbi:inorganic phosphate transporter [Flavobacterium sp. NRK F10]|uniref:inorganic phosphate transporter n=1 Tax=Flavobacterium sp. NRK F10 TaxID=2954931 RepID=UPI00208FFDEC|nr:inorganic phosphate transporter [Flavobacterium sp. NRK F10]MCO6176411.1 inorganic phosphate transporter [Flavobacterium sp. NRK F10]